jgi:hypothetical protein
MIALELPAGTKATRRRVATSILSLLVGTLQLARLADKEQSDRILESGIEGALALARSLKS